MGGYRIVGLLCGATCPTVLLGRKDAARVGVLKDAAGAALKKLAPAPTNPKKKAPATEPP